MLQWARGNGCPWDQNACSNAAREGRLDTLRWVGAGGCSWDHIMNRLAALYRKELVMEWAKVKGYPQSA